MRRRLDLGGGEGGGEGFGDARVGARDDPPPRGAPGLRFEGVGAENPKAGTEVTSPLRPPPVVGHGMPSADGGPETNASATSAPSAATRATAGTSDGELATTPTKAATTTAAARGTTPPRRSSAERTDPTEATPARATKANAAQDATLDPPSARTAGEEEEEANDDEDDAEGVPDSVLRMFRVAEHDADTLLADVLASPEPEKKEVGGGGDREAEGAGSLEGRRPLPPPSSRVAAAAPGDDVGREDEGDEADEASTAAPLEGSDGTGAFPRPVLADAAPDGAGGGSRASRGEGRLPSSRLAPQAEEEGKEGAAEAERAGGSVEGRRVRGRDDDAVAVVAADPARREDAKQAMTRGSSNRWWSFGWLGRPRNGLDDQNRGRT